MSDPVFVSDNIQRIENAIKQYQDNIKDTERHIEEIQEEINKEKNEILRLEGCLITFKGFRDAGIEYIMTTEEQDKLRQGAEDTHNERVEFLKKREDKINEDLRKLERYEAEMRERQEAEGMCEQTEGTCEQTEGTCEQTEGTCEQTEGTCEQAEEPTTKEWISASCHMI
jgi:prefoldin subunit 5